MRPSFHPRLVNPPFGDPGLFVPFVFQTRALLFDIGDISSLSNRDILKVTDVFVTHTHMDHFIGFDHLLRLALGREKTLGFFGPAGLIGNISGKLNGYTWNLVENYDNCFVLRVNEIRENRIVTQDFACQSAFAPDTSARETDFSGELIAEPAFTVTAVHLDHGIPCLGFAVQERFHVNIRPDALQSMGLVVGPWLKDFKEALFEGRPGDAVFVIPSSATAGAPRPYPLGELTEKIALITPGQKVAYVSDVGYSQANAETVVSLAQNADHLFIEAAFMDEHADTAFQKHHLTARQAGFLAARANVKQFTPFHFSPRYEHRPQELIDEARQAFESCRGRSL